MVVEKPGLRATTFTSDGRAAHIERTQADGSKMIVQRGLRDERRVEVIQTGGVRVVTVGQSGYVERPIRQGYVARTYVVAGQSEVRVYRTSVYQNVEIRSYVAPVVYRPVFYGWAVQPWREPVPYVWAPAPSTVAYATYYVPEPAYPTASHWIVDFMIAANLRNAYEAQAANNAGAFHQSPTGGSTVTRDIKAQLAGEVQQQIESEQAAASRPAGQGGATPAGDSLPAALVPGRRLFIVNANLDVTSNIDGQICTLTPGDIIQRTSDIVADDGKVAVTVLSSKSPNCSASFQTAVDLGTLQDMHNQFVAQISTGLGALATSSGKDGIPVAPAANPQAHADGQAPVDPQAGNLLKVQFTAADAAEEEAKLASESAAI